MDHPRITSRDIETWKAQTQCRPPADTTKARLLRELAGEYHTRTEAYDSLVSDARNERGEAVAISNDQQRAMQANASRVRSMLIERIQRSGYDITPRELGRAIRDYRKR